MASVGAHVFPRVLLPKGRYKHALRDPDLFFSKMVSACNLVAAKAARPGYAYAVSKNFVRWYCTSQAARFGSRGGRILSVSPGSIDTPMGRLEEQTGSGAMLEFAALKRFGRPDEIAELLAYCISDRASYLTGVDIICDGGVMAAFTLKNLIATTRMVLAK